MFRAVDPSGETKMFQIISAAIASMALAVAYAAAWRIYRMAWVRKAAAPPDVKDVLAGFLHARHRRRLKARFAGARSRMHIASRNQGADPCSTSSIFSSAPSSLR
jgi:hypothetical protein